MRDHKFEIIVGARDETKRVFASVEKRLRGLSASVSKVNAAFAAIGALGAGLTFKAVIDATRRQEAALAQLEARLKSTGAVAGLTKKQLTDFAASLQKVTTFGDEAVAEMESLLLTFTNIRGGVFQEAVRAVLDMSVAMGTDLKSAALQLGKALNDPVKGLTALTRVGVAFSDAQKKAIKAMVETGDVAGAQRLILQELNAEFGGAAQAAADTFGGALQQLQNAMGDLLEAPGGMNDAKQSVQELTALFQDPEFVRGINQVTSALISGFAAAAQVISDVGNITRNWKTRFGSPETLDLQQLQKRRVLLANRYVQAKENGDEQHLAALRKEIDLLDELIIKKNRELQLERDRAKQTGKPTEAGTPDNPTGKPYSISLPKTGSDTKLVTAYQRSLEQMQRQVALLGKTSEYERTLWEIQNGRYKDLTANQQKALLDAARAVDARRAELEAAREAARTREEEQAAMEAYNQAQEEAAQRWRELVNPMEKVDEQLVQLDTLLQEGRISWDTYAEAVFKVTEQMDEASTKTDKATSNMDQYAIQAARNMQTAFADFLFDPFHAGLKGMLRDFINTLRRMAAEALAAQIFKKLFGGPGGFFGITLPGFAEGGYVTGPGTATSDSIPARLSAGEYVLNADAVRRVGVRFLDQLNDNYRPPVWRGPELAFSGGGLVPSGGPAQAQNLNVQIFDDRQSLDQFALSPTNEKAVLIHIQRNAEQIKRLIS